MTPGLEALRDRAVRAAALSGEATSLRAKAGNTLRVEEATAIRRQAEAIDAARQWRDEALVLRVPLLRCLCGAATHGQPAVYLRQRSILSADRTTLQMVIWAEELNRPKHAALPHVREVVESEVTICMECAGAQGFPSLFVPL